MKQLLAIFAIAFLMVACGETQNSQTEEVAVEEVAVDSTTIGTTTDLEDSVEVVEESAEVSEEAPVQE
jgi:PBP1b-binding outer membrane lipoprotein LpoB